MIKLCIFDVDGTLYDLKQHRIPDSTILAIQKLKEKGILCCIATGRCHYALGKALNDLNMDYVIAVNGNVIVDQNQNVLYRQDLDSQEVEKLVSFALENQAGFCLKFIDAIYIYQYPEKIDWFEGQINSDIGKEPFKDGSAMNHHKMASPQSASIHASKHQIEKAFKESNLDFLQYSEDGFDVVSKHSSKKTGIEKLMSLCNIKRNEIVVFGDNYNDLEMFQTADIRVAMGNAVDELKQHATFITKDCDQDGIYHACVRLKLIEEEN